jgi:hypothetical protein
MQRARQVRISTIATAKMQPHTARIEPTSTAGVVAIALNPTAHQAATTTATSRVGGAAGGGTETTAYEVAQASPLVADAANTSRTEARFPQQDNPANCSPASRLIAP